MGSSMIHNNYRVVVRLRHPGDFSYCSISGQNRSPEEEKRDAEGLAQAILTKVSKFGDERGDVSVEFDTETVCEHCGSQWSGKYPNYNGGCCHADMDNEPVESDAP